MIKVHDHLNVLNCLNRFIARISHIRSIEALGKSMDEVFEEVLATDCSALYLFDRGKKQLRLVSAKGFSGEARTEAETRAMKGRPGVVYRTGALLSGPLSDQDPASQIVTLPAICNLRPSLCLPVSDGVSPVGALELAMRSDQPVPEEDLTILNFLCNLAGAVYHNIESFGEMLKTSLIARETDNAVVITDRTGNTEWVNKSFERITGYSFNEISGLKPGDLLQGPGTDPHVIREIATALEEKKPIERDVLNYHKDGHPYWVRIQIQPVFSDSGELTHFISLQTDITETKLADEKLRNAKTEAEAANVAKSYFLAHMSHEIRTPLNAVIGLSKLMQGTSLTPDQKKLNDKLLVSGENLLGIINEILDFSKIEAGKVELESVPFRINDCFGKVYSFMEHLAEEKMIALRTSLDPGITKPVLGDPVRLQQVLVNLVNNALKFTHQGNVSISCQLISEAEGRYNLLFAVKDTGIGISEDKLKSIFDMFSQENESTTRIYGGTGLGLTISRQLVELMGGKLSIESEKGKGSRFFFRLSLPVTDQQHINEFHKKIRIDPEAFRGKRILVVEDNQFNQFIAQSILEKWNVSVTLANHGEAAIEAARTGFFDLILMDMQMPVLDGCSATRILREELKLNIPIVALTAYATQDAIKKAKEAGMDSYLSKPFEEEKLYALIAGHFGHTLDFIRSYVPAEPTTGYPGKDEQTHFDLSKLTELLGDHPGELLLVVEKFIEMIPEYSHSLFEAYDKSNLEELAEAAHRIKSSLELLATNSLIHNITLIHDYAKHRHHTERLPKLINFLKSNIPVMIRQLREKADQLTNAGGVLHP